MLESAMKHVQDFVGVFALVKLPAQVATPSKLVVNLQYANLPGNHWTAIYCDADSVGYYFDSFGRIPPHEIHGWLAQHCARWTWNVLTIQKQSDTVSCGYLCIEYLKSV